MVDGAARIHLGPAIPERRAVTCSHVTTSARGQNERRIVDFLLPCAPSTAEPRPYQILRLPSCAGVSGIHGVPRVSLVFLLSGSLVAAIAFNSVMAVMGFAQGGIALSGTPAVGWPQAILAFLAFTLVFGKVRRSWAGNDSSFRQHL